MIQSEEQLKLIDLGGVRSVDDEEGAIYGTVGYQAPEVAKDGPSVCSDLYTVGRALAVLTFDFKGYSGRYATSLPPRAEVPMLAEHESFYRLLRRATNPDPLLRFSSAAEMAEQLTGVLREVLAIEDGEQRPAISSLFAPELRTIATTDGGPAPALAAASLPAPLGDPSDPAASYLAGLSAAAPADVIRLLAQPPVSSPEESLRLVRALIEAGEQDQAAGLLAGLGDSGDWRPDWYRGLAELAAGRPGRQWFDLVYDLLPGEAAPKLALAVDAELSGDLRTAALGLDAERRERMEAEVLESALAIARAGTWPAQAPGWNRQILGQGLTEDALRLGLERTYRTLAHLAASSDDRIALVERANFVRPRTLV